MNRRNLLRGALAAAALATVPFFAPRVDERKALGLALNRWFRDRHELYLAILRHKQEDFLRSLRLCVIQNEPSDTHWLDGPPYSSAWMKPGDERWPRWRHS